MTAPKAFTVVILESPYSGDIDRNVAYLQRAMHDARTRGEVVIAPHMMWTQHHLCPTHYVSDYDAKYEVPNGGREIALQQIHELRRRADLIVFYMDYGMSSGMRDGMDQCIKENLKFEERTLGDTHKDSEIARVRKKTK